MIRITEPRPGFLASAMKDVERKIPGMVRKAIAQAAEPFVLEYCPAGTDCLLHLMPIKGRADFSAVQAAWMVYVRKNGLPKARTRFELVGGALVKTGFGA